MEKGGKKSKRPEQGVRLIYGCVLYIDAKLRYFLEVMILCINHIQIEEFILADTITKISENSMTS